MKLRVDFYSKINIHELEKNYSGMIRLNPPGFRPQTYYFLYLNPYGGKNCELGIFTDEDKTISFAEAIGKGTLGVSPQTGKPRTALDFGSVGDLEKQSVIFIILMILSEAVYRIELKWKDRSVKMLANQVLTEECRHVWRQNFPPNVQK